ncbi:MAG: hypothetical protein WEB06_11900 [Actinomycetota bacterium]
MVHALEEIHRLLKPTGRLFDIHPVSESMPVEIHRGGRIVPVGELSVRQWCTDFQQADDSLTEVTQRGLFIVEDEGVFESPTYYGSVEEMRTALRGSIDRFARDAESADEATRRVEELAARSEELMRVALDPAELVARERTHIRRLRPVYGRA